MTKDIIRKNIIGKRSSLSNEYVRNISVYISKKLINFIDNNEFETFLSYIPFKNEVDIELVNKHILNKNLQIFLPKVEGNKMNFYQYNKGDKLVKSRFGNFEPTGKTLRLKKGATNNLMLILPTVAIDKNMRRIGFGKGYYDRYFSDFEPVFKVSPIYSWQQVSKNVCNNYDVKVDKIISELDTAFELQ